MDLPFRSTRAKKPDELLSVDFGSKVTKAVVIERKSDRLVLRRYSLHDSPVSEKSLTPQAISDHLKKIGESIGSKIKNVVVSIGVNEAVLRNTELPQMGPSEMRLMLKFNAKNYLQQDLPDHVFDVHVVPPRVTGQTSKPEPGKTKVKVWVGAAKRELVQAYQAAAKNAGYMAHGVTLSSLGPVNAFEKSVPQVFFREIGALVDIGFRTSTINVVSEGELLLSRVVGIGGDKITLGIAEAMGISYAEAETMKIGGNPDIEGLLTGLISPLGRELRASIDFFEHQNDKTVGQVFISGGSARSEFMVQSLQTELMVPCKSWNPTSFMELNLPPEQIGEIEQISPQLTVAIGSAVPFL